jgi:hypothetical protein
MLERILRDEARIASPRTDILLSDTTGPKIDIPEPIRAAALREHVDPAKICWRTERYFPNLAELLTEHDEPIPDSCITDILRQDAAATIPMQEILEPALIKLLTDKPELILAMFRIEMDEPNLVWLLTDNEDPNSPSHLTETRLLHEVKPRTDSVDPIETDAKIDIIPAFLTLPETEMEELHLINDRTEQELPRHIPLKIENFDPTRVSDRILTLLPKFAQARILNNPDVITLPLTEKPLPSLAMLLTEKEEPK